MFEVEAKVKVTLSDYRRLSAHLKKVAGEGRESVKNDTYFADTKAVHMRTRVTGKKTVFTIKQKALQGSVEANCEMEWEIKDPAKWKKLLSKLGILPFIRKSKSSLTYRYKNFTLELNHIRELGYYLEIEKIVEDPKEVKTAKKELVAMFKELGYNQNQFEGRYYLDLLEQVRK